MLDEGYHSNGLTVVSTDDQYAGRGQQGNSWESEPSKNLSFSFLVHPEFIPASSQFILSQAMSLAMLGAMKTIDGLGDGGFSVKWPNDIYSGDLKLGGTLIECDLQGKSISNCIIGTGLNVNQEKFHSDAPNPVSLRQLFGKDFNRDQLLESITNEFATRYEQLESREWTQTRKEYADHLYRREGYHPYADTSGHFMARIVEIEESGHLILQDERGHLRRYAFKEVRFCKE